VRCREAFGVRRIPALLIGSTRSRVSKLDCGKNETAKAPGCLILTHKIPGWKSWLMSSVSRTGVRRAWGRVLLLANIKPRRGGLFIARTALKTFFPFVFQRRVPRAAQKQKEMLIWERL